MTIETERAAGPPAGEPSPAAGEATRRFLAAAADRPPAAPVASAAKATGAYKRYANTARLPLPDDPLDARPAPGPALTGHLMRHLLGIGRFVWTYASLVPDGRPGPGQAAIVRGHRPVPSGGALYPVEAYLAGGSHGFPPGLHHYDRAHHALQRVREGDHRTALREALTAPAATPPDLLIVFTAVFWRTGVKYGDFAYKLQCQETGALIAQSLALAEDLGLSARIHLDFDGPLIERLLDLPEGAEGALAVLGLTATARGDRRPPGPGTAPGVAEIIAGPAAQAVDPPPPVAGTLPHLAALHAAATTRRPGAYGGAGVGGHTHPGRTGRAGRDVSSGDGPAAPVPVRLREGIGHRRSAPAGFDPAPVGLDAFTRILAAAARGHPGDLDGAPEGLVSCALYAWALRVDGVPPGSYRYDPANGRLDAVAPWRSLFAIAAGLLPHTRLALGEAAAVIFPVGDPLEGVARSGDAWYRCQLIETGLVVHRATLAATALGLASRIHSDVCGEAADAALGLHGPGRRGLSALLVGRPPRRTPIRWDLWPVADRHRPD